MKSAASPRNETTKLSALATGLRLITTAAPNTSISRANDQNRNGDIARLFAFVPLQHHAVHDAADLEQLVLVMHHVFAGEPGDRVVFPKVNCLLGTNLFTH